MLVKASEEAMAVREIEDGVDSNNSREINSIHLKQQHFVLVHGIGGGGWCWYKIKCLMENSGYKVSCIDLKSSGIDQSDADSILTFDDYNKPVIDFMSALPDNEQVILVGHSAGGLSITQACHKFANKVSLAVYVAATMLKFGYSTDEDLKDDSTLAAMLLRPGPLLALTRAQFIENVEVEKVPRVYIKTRQDNVVKPKQQEAMINRWPPGSVYELDSDHSPFFSTPFILFGLLVKAATFHVGCN
ncbi:methylesterase 17 isoform X2 [Medicago truncatula]|uniref:Methylesterase n=1 Tax=Medicago truncatula TaxID=3880 RepID=A0A072VBG1_MEDTR|nr:methylesterase 17 isoform X2 [Medicago truncatula]KEH35520.1 methylesterase [Medicago truncatula]